MKLLVYSFLIISFVFSYQSKENGLAAVVGDELILISDLNKSMTDLGKNFFGVDFSVSQLSQQEYNSFKKDVLDLLIGNKLILLSAEEDTLISIGYDQINSFLDETRYGYSKSLHQVECKIGNFPLSTASNIPYPKGSDVKAEWDIPQSIS